MVPMAQVTTVDLGYFKHSVLRSSAVDANPTAETSMMALAHSTPPPTCKGAIGPSAWMAMRIDW